MAPRIVSVEATWLLLDVAQRGEERPAGVIWRASVDGDVLGVTWRWATPSGREDVVTLHDVGAILKRCPVPLDGQTSVVRADPASDGAPAVDLLVDVEGAPEAARGIPTLGALGARGFRSRAPE